MRGLITKIQRFSVHDGPGIRTTVFLKGCPLACAWCQNPETIDAEDEVLFDKKYCSRCRKCIEACPQHCFYWEGEIKFKSEACDRCGLCIQSCPIGALQWSAESMSVEKVMEEVARDKEFYEASGGGLTISGGEPLQQIEFCLELAKRAKWAGISVAIDTSGFASPEAFKKIMPYVDHFLYDLKIFDNDLHLRYVGKPNQIILENFKLLCSLGKNIVVRIPLVPGLTDSAENLSKITDFVKSCREGIEIEKIPFNALMKEKYRMLGKEQICLSTN